MNDLLAKHELNAHVFAMSKMKGIIFSPWLLHWLSLCFMKFDTFCKGLLGPCNVQELPISHKWVQGMCQLEFLISIKEAQYVLQKIITRTKKIGKGWWEWHKACELVGMLPCKFKLLYKLTLLQETSYSKKLLNSTI